MLLSVVANTVIHPRAVMIHSSYASFAGRAMMRLRWFDAVAFFTFLRENFVQVSHISSIYQDSFCQGLAFLDFILNLICIDRFDN